MVLSGRVDRLIKNEVFVSHRLFLSPLGPSTASAGNHQFSIVEIPGIGAGINDVRFLYLCPGRQGYNEPIN